MFFIFFQSLLFNDSVLFFEFIREINNLKAEKYKVIK